MFGWNCFRLDRPTFSYTYSIITQSHPASTAAINMSKHSEIPNLDLKHNGIPERLRNEANAAKDRVYALKTLPSSVPRRAPLRLPPNTSQEKFDVAISALQKLLGEDDAELNIKPLVDGWYMEHP